MIVTDNALKALVHVLETHAEPVTGIRIKGEYISPLKVNFKLTMTQKDSVTEEDKINSFEYEDSIINIYMDPESQPYGEYLELDYVENLMTNSFKIDYKPPIPEHIDEDVLTSVQRILEDKINPSIASHGGHVSLVDLKDNIMFLQMEGGCQGCAASSVTLREGIEKMIKEELPQIEEIIDITNHAMGKNPYYKPPGYEDYESEKSY